VHGGAGFSRETFSSNAPGGLEQTERKEPKLDNRRLIRMRALVPSAPEIR
jgi:hypothetical protein